MAVIEYGISCYKCVTGWKFKSESEMQKHTRCPKCYRLLDPDDRFWVCSCGTHNDMTNEKCYRCDENSDGSIKKKKTSWW